MKKPVNLFCIYSRKASAIIPGPMVILRKAREGGYLLTFKKDKKVNRLPLGWCDIGNGSPYPFKRRRIINKIIKPVPIPSNIFLRHKGSTALTYNFPKQYPSIITPNQGRKAYTIRKRWFLSK